MEYNVFQLLLCIIASVLCCYFLIKRKHVLVKAFYVIFFVFFTLYSGVGGTASTANPSYMGYYYYYLIVFTLASLIINNRLYKKHYDIQINSFGFDTFISKYATGIVVIYILVHICELLYPENKLSNLIHPPSPDIQERLNFYREGSSSTLLTYLEILLTPFFF